MDGVQQEGRRWPSLAAVVGAGLGLWGLIIGIGPLHDNSFLTHLATGRLIFKSGIPRTDPYSFTAHGRAWVVQSWLASVFYEAAEKLGGLGAIRLLVAASTVGLALVVWRLTRPAHTLVGRLGVAALVIGIGCSSWVERPLTFALLGMGAVLIACEGGLDPRWLVPVMWMWVNIHGSFPLAMVLVAVLALGRRLDKQPVRTEMRVLLWVAVGTALGAINPLGPRLLLFPLQLLQHTQSFQAVAEWQPPKFNNFSQQLFLLQLVCAAGLLLRRRSWRYGLVLVIFGAMALTSARNIVVCSLVLVPLMAEAARDLGSVNGEERSRMAAIGIGAIALLGLLIGTSQLGSADTNLRAYPEQALTWMAVHGYVGPHSTARVVTRDYVGNLLEAKYGARANVYIDDRVDMYPAALVQDYVKLLHVTPGWESALSRARPAAVLWDRASKLGKILEKSSEWRVIYRDASWLVVVPASRASAAG